jgi:hypothetical protein
MSTPREQSPKHSITVEQVFKEFGEPGYFLSPHKSRFGKFIYKNIWLLAVVLLILALFLFIRHFSLSTAWEYRRLIYQYHTLYQDELISLEAFDDLERRILYKLNIENNYNDDPDDDSYYWMDELTWYLEYHGDLYIPYPDDNLIFEYPEGSVCDHKFLHYCYWEFFYEVLWVEEDLVEETAVNAIWRLFTDGYISEAELNRLYNEVVDKPQISETTGLEIQAHFVRGFLEGSQIVSNDNGGQKPPEDHRADPPIGDGADLLHEDLEAQAQPHQLEKISAYIIHLLDRFLAEVASFAFLTMTIFWSRSFFNIAKQAPATFFELAAIGRIRVPDSEGEGLDVDNTKVSRFKRQWILGKQLIISKPHWKDYAIDLRDSVSSPWSVLLFIFWIAFVVLVLNLAGMDFSQLTLDFEYPEVWLVTVIALIAAYIYTVQFWVQFAIARYLQMLPLVFNLDINFKHYDRSGGLGRIGNLSFKMAMIYLSPAILVAVFLTYIFFRSTTEVIELAVVSFRFNWLLSVISLGIVILLALANLTFFLPLWGIHKQMELKKAEYEDNALLLTLPIEEQLRELILSEEDQYLQIEELEKRLVAIELLYPSHIRLSTWPISSSAFISFITTQVIPVLSLIGTVISLFT